MFNNSKTDRNNESSNCSKLSVKASLGYFSKFSKRSRRQRRNDKSDEGGEEEDGGFGIAATNQQHEGDNENGKNASHAQLNTSSASSSGYMSGLKPMQYMPAATTNRSYTSQQHFYHFGGSNGAHDTAGQLISDNSNGIDVDSSGVRRLPNQVRQLTDRHHHHHQLQQQQQQQQARYLPQSNSNRLQGGHNQVPMMVPMMIDDDNNHLASGSDDGDDNIGNVVRHESDSNGSNNIGAAVIGADGGLDVDGVDLIDDDIGENLNGRPDDNGNYKSSTCYSANRLRSLYAARLNRGRDCAFDPPMSVVDHRNHHHHQQQHQQQHQDRYFQQQEQQQQQQVQYLAPTSTRSRYPRKQQYFNSAVKSFAPPQPLHNSMNGYIKYHDANEDPDLSLPTTATTYHQPISAIYHQPNIPDYQLQQQYHSFSYLQPQHQLHQLQQQYPSSLIHRTLHGASNNRLASSTIHLLPTSSSQLESSSAAGESSNSSSTATGAPIDSRLALQPDSKSRRSSSSKSNAKMQNSRQQQHFTSDTSHHHHHHHQQKQHQQQSSKRKLQNVGSRKKTYQNEMNSNNIAVDRQVSERPGLSCCAKMAKLLLFITNVTFWSAGIALGAWGILSLVEDHKHNLSQLLVFESNTRMSLFQLLAWSFITLGCATILVGFCGCSAILKNNRWILGLYIFLILAIFALDLATGLLAIIFQEKLVANVRLRLVNKLRSEYGVQASFTAAIDYIQTKYECCGLEGHFDYDQSLWRLQRLGGFEATVARTCCHLRNSFDDHAHINPRPVNESMCQSTDVRFHQSYRYRKGCLDDLEKLIRQKIWTFTIGCIAVGGVILLSLIFATCFCRSIPSSKGRKNSRENQITNHLDGKKQQGIATTTAIMYQQNEAQQKQQQQRHYRLSQVRAEDFHEKSFSSCNLS